MAKTADIKNGMCLEFDGQYYYVVEFLHVKPGKGPAFVRTKLKNVKTGLVIEKTLNAGIKINDVRIERRIRGKKPRLANQLDFRRLRLHLQRQAH